MTIQFRLFLAALTALSLLGLCVHRADAATVNGSITHASKYEDGSDLGTNYKQARVEVGTCVGTAFGVKEGETTVAPGVTAWSVVVPRAFGDFCARALSETVSGITSIYTAAVKVTKVEPKPNPPVLSATITAAYEFSLNAWGEVKLGKAVGTVEKGAPCVDNPIWTNKGEYYEIAPEQVSFYPGKPPKSSIVLTKCEWRS